MSENKKYFYLKLKDSFFSSEEMMMLESLPDGLVYQNIYLRMCLLSLKNDGALTFKNMLPYDLQMLSTVLRIDIAKMKMAVELFEKLGLVTKTDNEVLFMSDIQALIGKSSTEAERIANYRKRIAGCTKSVQMLQDCTPKIELKLELEKEKKTDTEIDDVPAYIQQPLKITQTDYKTLKERMFNMIEAHNETARHKIPIPKYLIYFEQKEGSRITNLLQQYNAQEIESALKNFLKTANMDSWKTSFSFSAFCNNVQEYLPEFFDITKYMNMPKGGLAQFINDFISEKMEQHLVFRLDAFIYHRQDWLKAGMPDGKELQKMVKQWEMDDEKNKIDYYIVNDNWEKQGGEK